LGPGNAILVLDIECSTEWRLRQRFLRK